MGNLFVDCGYAYHPDVGRRSQFFQPHTTKPVGRKTGTVQDDKWFNNLFVRQGLDRVKPALGYVSDYNVFLEGAKASLFGDQHSLVDPFALGLTVEDHPQGASITLTVNHAPSRVRGPLVDAKLVGLFPTVGQTIEDRDGRPLAVDKDIHGNPFSPPIPGPLADLHPGKNRITWTLRRGEQ